MDEFVFWLLGSIIVAVLTYSVIADLSRPKIKDDSKDDRKELF